MLTRVATAVAGTAMMFLAAGASPAAAAPAAPAVPAAAADAAGTIYGCEEGYVCIYPDATFNSNPILKFYTYGAHNLSNVYGNKILFNNQTGGAKAQECYNYGGTNCEPYIYPLQYVVVNFTPVNSVRLTA